MRAIVLGKSVNRAFRIDSHVELIGVGLEERSVTCCSLGAVPSRLEVAWP